MLSLALLRISTNRPAGLAWYDVPSWRAGYWEALDELSVSLGPVGRYVLMSRLADELGIVESPEVLMMLSRASELPTFTAELSRHEGRFPRAAARVLRSWGLVLSPLTPESRAAYDETDPALF